MNKIFSFLILLISFTSFGSDVVWTSRLEGNSLSGGQLNIEDGDYAQVAAGTFFTDVNAVSYLRLGLTERTVMEYLSKETRVTLSVRITRYDNNNQIAGTSTEQLEVVYSPNGASGVTVDAEDFRMTDVHKFTAEVLGVAVAENNSGAWTAIGTIPSFVYLEAGFSSERYYSLSMAAVPVMKSWFVQFNDITFAESKTLNTANFAQTDGNTDEIELSWTYVAGAEYYDLEWTWVDNYEKTASELILSESDFQRNCTRVRLRGQSYRIPQVFAKGYLVYRVRGVGRWLQDVSKDKYGHWSTSAYSLETVADWPGVVEIGYEHEAKRNWQYQATYAEEGKKKEVLQYFDGKLANRQTVTKLNSTNQSVVGETIYDNEGRGVVQILPVPQDNPALQFYGALNRNSTGAPYNYTNFDLEDATSGQTPVACETVPADQLSGNSGAGLYYSAAGHATDTDWQRYVPESDGYAFTQIEYTPDNTGRIRNQSGVGATHKLGSGHETMYYYLQPSQEELNRLFGYKVGYKQRYKKNMVVDANGQVSVSYLDAQGRVIATAIAGANTTPLETLPGAPEDAMVHTDLLNKLDAEAFDTEEDDNKLESTGQFGSEKDILRATTQLGVTSDGTTYHFNYTAQSGVYTEAGCDQQAGVSYPYVYDLTISIKDDCGNELFTQTQNQLGVAQIDGAAGAILSQATGANGIILDIGSYTVYKELRVNEDAYNLYLNDYLSIDGNPCLQQEASFASEVEGDCNYSCAQCVEDLGTEAEFIVNRAQELYGAGATATSLTTIELQEAQALYIEAKEACIEPCTPLQVCDSYWEQLKGDVGPQGQYGSLNSGDVLSVYNSANSLTGSWRTPTGGNYLNPDGTTAYVEVNWNSETNTFEPALNTGVTPPTADAEGRYWVLPKNLLNVTDFLTAMNSHPEWLDQLVPFHPEYKLYNYVETICSTTASVSAKQDGATVTVGISSEDFDVYLRDYTLTFDQFLGNNQDIYINQVFYDGLIYKDATPDQTGHAPIYVVDPYFTLNYGSIHALNDVAGNTSYDIDNDTRKRVLMKYSIEDNYNNSGMPMLEYAIRTALGGYDLAALDITPFDTWAEMEITSALTTAQKDAVWQQYKSFYLSEKQRINQLLLDQYGFYQSPGLYNGAIGSGGLSVGIVLSFENHPVFPLLLSDIYHLWGITNFPPSLSYYPYTFWQSMYNSKQYRIGRVDAVTDPAQDDASELADLAAQADYVTWQSTGQCPLTLDLEKLIKQLAVEDKLTSSNVAWNDLETLTPDLVTAITGLDMNGAQGQNIHVSGDVSNSILTLTLHRTGDSDCMAVLPEIHSTLPWDNYGIGWRIYNVSQSFAENNTTVKILVKAGVNAQTADEYVVSYTSCIDVNTCQAEYLGNNALDPDCEKKDDFEDAMHDLLDKLLINEQLYNNSVNLSSYSEYTTTILKDYFGTGAVWNGSSASISNTSPNRSFSFGSNLPSGVVAINGFNLSGTTVHISYATLQNNTPDLAYQSAAYTYINNGVASLLNFNCSCEELNGTPAVAGTRADHDLKLKALVNHLFDRVKNNQAAVTSYDCAELDAFEGYYQADLRLNLSYTLNASTCNGQTYYYPTQGVNSNPQLLLSFVDATSNVEICATVFVFNVADVQCGNYSLSELTTTAAGGLTYRISPTRNRYSGKYECSPVLETSEPCVECPPVAQAPVSCTEAFTDYKAFVESTIDIGADNYVEAMDEATFCNLQFAYITEAYEHYLTALSIDNTTDYRYMTIGEFGNTPMGYSNTYLTAAVNAYQSYLTTNSGSTIVWQEYIKDHYLPSLTSPLCPAITPVPILPAIEIEAAPCDQWEENISAVNAQNQYGIYLNQVAEAFRHQYITGAMASVVETFDENHEEKEYHYTLYYYDRGGNLVQTVPPVGVERLALNEAQNDVINNYRADNPTATAEGSGFELLAPDHTYQTDYRYNSLNQLVYQNTPDGGESRFAYDKLGRLVVSQNAKQKAHYEQTEINGNPVSVLKPKFSYTLYDELGRVIEVGEFMTHSALLSIDDQGHLITTASGNWFDVNSTGWINMTGFQRGEVTRTVYDELKYIDPSTQQLTDMTVPSNTTAVTVRSQFGTGYHADNTRNRIVGVIYQSVYDAAMNVYDNGTFYNYDVHGNVEDLMQVNNAANLVVLNQHIKKFRYEYDLVSGNVNKVIYQKGKQDQFMHRYQYDSDNRITIAETSKDGFVWEKDAKYFYYDHGPLARTEIGERKVQAEDYAYTIQGWLKAVNGEQLDANTMMGVDGAIGVTASNNALNKQVARDAFGYALHYFAGDYEAAGMEMLQITQVNGELNMGVPSEGGSSLYNGNIRSMFTAISKSDETAMGTHQTTYRYDQLNRLIKMKGHNVATDGVVVGTELSGNESQYTYDANGNLLTMKNWAKTASNQTKQMDNFGYHYTAGTNQLTHVDDIDPTNGNQVTYEGLFDSDVDDQDANNYGYDQIGQLVKDNAEEIEKINWTVTNKVKEVIYNGSRAGEVIRFDYNAMGHRIAKHHQTAVGTKSTYYVLDAQGNQMGIYELKDFGDEANKLYLSEMNMFGSKRLGTEMSYTEMVLNEAVFGSNYHQKQEIGDKRYELANHLGNVLNVVTDRKLPKSDNQTVAHIAYYQADVVSYSDYLPFGQTLPGRSGGDYRYGFNGMEEDTEIKGEDNSYDFGARMYDPRIGRWLSRDAMADEYSSESPYSFTRNSPLKYIDKDGNKWINVHEENIKELKTKLEKTDNKKEIKRINKQIIYQQKLANQVSLTLNTIKENDPSLYYYIENLQVQDAGTSDCLDVNVRVEIKTNGDAPEENVNASTTYSRRDSQKKKKYIRYNESLEGTDVVPGPINSKDEIGFDVVLYGNSELFNDIYLANEAGDVMFAIEYPLAAIRSGTDEGKSVEEYIKKRSAGAYSFDVENTYKDRKKSGEGKKNEDTPYPIKMESNNEEK